MMTVDSLGQEHSPDTYTKLLLMAVITAVVVIRSFKEKHINCAKEYFSQLDAGDIYKNKTIFLLYNEYCRAVSEEIHSVVSS